MIISVIAILHICSAAKTSTSLSQNAVLATDNLFLLEDDECYTYRKKSAHGSCALHALQLRGKQQAAHQLDTGVASLDMDSFGESPSDDLLWQKYQTFLSTFDRRYTKEERDRRFENFKKTYWRARELNAVNGAQAFGMNRFADFDRHELPAKGLRLDNVTEAYRDSNMVLGVAPMDSDSMIPSDKPEPRKIDWRLTKAITPVKNQGVCGACWAFSSAEEVESMYVLWNSVAGGRSEGYQEVFSVQQLASCATEAQGCGGGNPINAFQYLKSNPYGLAQEEFWPYEGGLIPKDICNDQGCTKPCLRDLKDIQTYRHIIGPSAQVLGAMWATPLCTPGTGCQEQNLEMLRRVLVELGPVAVAVNSKAWYDYSTGVLTEKGCLGSGWTDLDHAAQLTGYDTTGDAPYWIVRNQWSTSWGMHGYIHLEYGKNTCGIANMAAVPVMQDMPAKVLQSLGVDVSLLQQEDSRERAIKQNFEIYYQQATGDPDKR